MKKTIFILIALVAFVSCKEKKEKEPETKIINTEVKKNTSTEIAAHYDKAEFKIDGMTCAVGCAKRIEKKLAAMEGVKSAKVDFDQKLAMVEYNDKQTNLDALTKTVSKVSDTYKVSDMKKVKTFTK